MRAATLIRRTWAALADANLLVAWILLIAIAHPFPEWLPGPLRIAAWFGLPLLLEPIMIRFFGHTAGQGILGLRVVSAGATTHSMPKLILRHLSKVLFLGFSLLFVPFSPRRQALHDHLFETSVVFADESIQPSAAPALQSPLRAFLVSLFLATVAGLLSATVAGVFVGIALALLGFEVQPGTPVEAFVSLVLLIAFAWAQFTVLFRGASGRLPGTGGLSVPGTIAA